MPVHEAFIVPHPPLIIPEVGRGQQDAIRQTVAGYNAVGKEIAEISPETIVVISPHSTLYADYIHISPGKSAKGSLQRFGADREYRVNYDVELVEEISRLCVENNFPAGTAGERDKSLDHATIVPLHFIEQSYSGYMLVRVSISGLSRLEHYRFGTLLGRAVENTSRSAVIVASGDLSHKLTADGPYGFAPEGPKLDAELVKIMRSGSFGDFFGLDASLCENAAECGLSGFVMMAGALDQKAVSPRFYSYEGPFGVGYAVCSFSVAGNDSSRDFLAQAREKSARRLQSIRSGEDGYVRLARETLEHYVRTGELPALPDNLPDELLSARAGAFVSIKKDGRLRGCIGTTEPTQPSLAQEIMSNAVSSGTRDPRFSPVEPSELDGLVYSVDVLSPQEPINDKSELDERRYGVIVQSGRKRGLLLPNLEGVNSVDEQLDIACQKAGIGNNEKYSIERFEVVRHK